MTPGRAVEIQRALSQSGYYRGEPTGRWDDQTRDAMRRYQAANGFGVTGLPDAKSLMKLGLGPHPLPDELATSSAPATPDLNPPATQSSAIQAQPQ
jgi:peptidoglycan hydrolase-like protein with peptidoglycan-binding domain